ncbi:hypothetical protein BDN70DRAFT_888934 [Pholiota conissans]|uniref:Uncharacterized protein n=1 Tax=Pholiota conissans TaxID=109636 RepID=A0A9P6CQW9_9AGAR|nr:hypothetical protein BDN70DRAFT_888934 [Pholiota conissans]
MSSHIPRPPSVAYRLDTFVHIHRQRNPLEIHTSLLELEVYLRSSLRSGHTPTMSLLSSNSAPHPTYPVPRVCIAFIHASSAVFEHSVLLCVFP